MEFTQITKESAEFSPAIEIYNEAFPAYEQAPIDLLLEAQEKSKCGVYALTDEGKTIGFSCLIPLSPNVMYLMFLAIDARERGHSYGTKALQLLKEKCAGKTIAFLVEEADETAANNAQRLKRISFYERCGCVLTEIKKEINGCRFVIMADKESVPQKMADITTALQNMQKLAAEVMPNGIKKD